MVILDLDEDKNLIADISGKEFYRDLNIVKSIDNASYNSEDKTWILPRDINTINYLESQMKVAYKQNKYTLSGQQKPYIKTAADIFIENYSSIDDYMSQYPIDSLYSMLKDFQKLGVSTALYNLNKYGGFLVADDMGTGKTVTAIAVASSLISSDKVSKVLVSCPKNVKFQWGHEIEKFSDHSYTVIDGYNKDKRLEKYEKDTEFYIINHDQLILDDDYQALESIGFDMIIADESHYFKNKDTKRSEAVKELTKNFDYRLGLTGTPLHNRPSDVHSIYEFLIPDYLRNWNKFSSHYIVWSYFKGRMIPTGYRNLLELERKISKTIIRRESDDVSDDLPNVHKKNHYLDMTYEQEVLHEQLDKKIESAKQEELDEDTEEEFDDGIIMGLMNMQLAVANHPRLLQMSESYLASQLISNTEYKSPKLDYLLDLLENILSHNNNFKVIIFSKFARMVNVIYDSVLETNYVDDASIIYGQLSEKRRDKEQQKFWDDDKCRILVSSDAGCEGLNLENASHLINFDLPWTSATLDQRNGRIRRIGSPWKNVFVSNLIMKDSRDIKVLETIETKRELYNSLINKSSSQKAALKKYVEKCIA